MNLNELTLTQAINGLNKKEFSSVDLATACIAAIKKYDGTLNAFVTILPEEEILRKAGEADDIISAEGEMAWSNRPLLGIPYACKDNFNTKGIKTTASSKVLENYIAPYESTVTKRLHEAGAMLLGKTNMDAFAHGSSTETSDFFVTKNPWNTECVPGGSSGGSAVAVAAHMCIFAIGSETAGSIRGPAAWTGVTGYKPTYGRVSRYGVIAMASSTDSPGPMTKTVEDSALVLSVIAGKDPLDATTSDTPVANYTEMNGLSIKGIKIGVPRSYFEIDMQPGVRERVSDAVSVFKELGAEVVEIDLLDPKYSIAVYTILQRSEVSSNLARFDGIRYGNDRQSFGFEAKKRMMLGAYALSAGYYDEYYAKAQKVRTMIVEDFNSAFEKVDLIIGPTMPSVALRIGESESNPMFGEFIDMLQEPSAIAGLTAVSFPVGLCNGLPVGAQLIGPQFNEAKVLGASHVYQQETEFHREFPSLESSEK